MKQFEKGLKQFLLDSFFPLFCLRCGKEGSALCAHCAAAVIGDDPQYYCPVCFVAREQWDVCASHRRLSSLDGLFALARHQDLFVQRALHALKYGYLEAIAEPLGRQLGQALSRACDVGMCIVPVPLSRRRMIARDFNQAELLAHAANFVPSAASCLCTNVLARTRHTKEQARLSREDRLMNVRDAFIARVPVAGTVVLIDDVTTTGATLQDCARALKRAGATRVFGAVIAHG